VIHASRARLYFQKCWCESMFIEAETKQREPQLGPKPPYHT
jgi:hypothetical protein